MTEQQIDPRERELDYWMARAYEAEGKLWKAEQRLAGWMEHWNATARTGAVDEVAAVLEANARADHAEARIKAVRDLHRPYGDTLTGLYVCTACDQPCPCPTTRALDGEA